MPVETSVSQSAVYRARPTLRLAGQEDVRVSELLIGMRIEESEGGMTTAELRFSNWASTTDNRADHAFEDGSRITLGTAIEVYAGDETQARELFRGVVSGLEAEFAQGAPPELVVLAEDPLAHLARLGVVVESGDGDVLDHARDVRGAQTGRGEDRQLLGVGDLSLLAHAAADAGL